MLNYEDPFKPKNAFHETIVMINCPSCFGSGKLTYGDCRQCSGIGKVLVNSNQGTALNTINMDTNNV